MCKKVIYSQFRNLNEYVQKEKEIFIQKGYSYEPHLDIIHNLDKPIDEQFSALHKGRRKNIRRAERAAVEFREILDEKEFYVASAKSEEKHKNLFVELAYEYFDKEEVDVRLEELLVAEAEICKSIPFTAALH